MRINSITKSLSLGGRVRELIRALIAVLVFLLAMPAALHGQHLDSLVQSGLSNNSSLRALEAKYESAKSRAGSVGFLPPPTLSIEFSQVPTSSVDIINNSLSNNISLSQMFMPGGKLEAMEQAELKALSVISQEIRNARIVAAADIRMAYYSAWQGSAKLKLLNESLDLYKSLGKAIDVSYRSGGISSADKYLLESITASVESQLAAASKEYESALNILQLKLQSAVRPVPVFDELLPPALPPDTDSLFSMLDNNPELLKMNAMADMKKAEMTANEKGLIPDVMVQAMFMRMPKGMILTVGTSMDMLTGKSSTEYMYSLMASVTLPFVPWSRGIVAGKSEELAAGIRQTKEEKTDMRFKMRADLLKLRRQYETSVITADRYQASVLPALEKAVAAAYTAYAAGSISLVQLIEYKKMQVMERMNYIMAAGDAWMAAAGIEMMTGKRN